MQIAQVNIVHTIAIIAMLAISCSSYGQTRISGVVTDTTGLSVIGAVVMCKDATGLIVAHDVTDLDGRYRVMVEQNIEVELSVTHLSYDEEITTKHLNRKEITWDCILRESSTLLNQIMITADYKKRDTVEFSMENLNLKEADNLKIILEKIPSFFVGDDGVILYEGKIINKILINEQAAFINQNTTALKSIQAKMIENLDVIHNHQNVFEINFDEVRETVINIDTKQSFKNIFSGSLAAHYGTSGTYDLSADLMKFSKGQSLIATHNTNTIGNKDMDLKEVQSLFGTETTFSYYQERLLSNLFEEREDFTANLFSHSTATARKRSNRLKLDGTLYAISNSLAQSSLLEIEDLNQEFYSENRTKEKVKGNSYLGNASVAYKLSPTSIVSYDVFANRLNGNDSSSAIANQFNLVSDSTFSSALFGERAMSSSFIDQSISYFDKISPRNILFAKRKSAKESTSYHGSNAVNGLPYSEDDGYQYSKELVQYDLGIKTKLSKYFRSTLSLNYSNVTEGIDVQDLEGGMHRSNKRSSLNWEAAGKSIFKYWEYDISTSLRYERHFLSNGRPGSFTFFPYNINLPYDIKLLYEKRKHGLIFKMERDFRANKIEHSFDMVEPMQFNIGSVDNISELSISENWMAYYSYNNLLEGETIDVRLYRNRYQNENALFFLENRNGVSSFEWLNVDQSSNYGISADYSRIVLPLKFPTKVDIGIEYKNSILPINASENTRRKYYDLSLNLRSMTAGNFNYTLSSQVAKLFDHNAYTSQNYTFMANDFSISFNNDRWDCELSLLQENHWINGDLRKRWNINSNASMNVGKFKLSIRIRHLGELLSLVNNQSYNYTYSQEGGLVYRSQRDQSLKYILAGLEFNF